MNRLKIILFITSIFLLSCINEGKVKEKEYRELFSEYIGKKVIFPDSLNVLLDKSVIQSEEVSLIKKNNTYKIVSLINGECGECLNDLNEWKDFIDKFEKKGYELSYLFYINYSDSAFFFNNLVPEINLNIPLILDPNKEFEKKNDILIAFIQFRTLLLDENNQIKLLGPPFMSRDMEILYDKVITKKFE
jgi:hypothetical protein